MLNIIKLIFSYQSNDKFNGDIVLIKAEIGNASRFGVGHDYGLSEVS